MGLLVVIYIRASLDGCAGEMKGVQMDVWLSAGSADTFAVRWFRGKDPSDRQVQTSVGNFIGNLNNQILIVLPALLFDVMAGEQKSLMCWFFFPAAPQRVTFC